MKMSKFLILCFCLMTFAFNQESKAQIDATINPIGLLFNRINVGADFALAENFSIEGNIGANFGSALGGDFKFFGLPVTAFGKYYFTPEAGADKFYGDVWLRFISRNYSYEGTDNVSDYTQSRLGLGFGIGYKAVAGKGLVFDIGLGAGRAFVDNTKFAREELDPISVKWPKLMFVFKTGIGYRFGSK